MHTHTDGDSTAKKFVLERLSLTLGESDEAHLRFQLKISECKLNRNRMFSITLDWAQTNHSTFIAETNPRGTLVPKYWISRPKMPTYRERSWRRSIESNTVYDLSSVYSMLEYCVQVLFDIFENGSALQLFFSVYSHFWSEHSVFWYQFPSDWAH